ncbi:hypothetical protein ED208_16890 [Stagnimonas aquatica]|uniref:Uncharacterized protein n=1 Tax=Stagnimonas aquatica TaxID=2689987 RepID=A0A3N0UYI1_9GAMM|nr:hypothetical protein ED208_16890 [Stagnimonas aquatica]
MRLAIALPCLAWQFARSRSFDGVLFAVFFSPIGDSLFFACAKKSKQKKAHPCVAPPSGVPCDARPKGAARELGAL